AGGDAWGVPRSVAVGSAMVPAAGWYVHWWFGDVGGTLARWKRARHVGVVAHHLAAHHRVRVFFARRSQPEATLERLEHRVVDLFGERRLRRLIVERQDGDGLDVRQAAAGEAVDARREREGERASDGRARSRDRTWPRNPPPRP